MPFEFNNKLVVTVEELVPDYYNTLQSLQQAIHRYKDKPYGIKAVQRGGNGRQLLIDFDSLDKDIQNAIGDPRKAKHLLENWYKVDADAVRFYTSEFKFEDGSQLPFKFQEEYIINASVLRALVELKKAREYERKTKGYSLKGLMRTLCADAQDFQKTLKAKHKVQHTLPESEKRFKETFKAFLNNVETGFNYGCLISGKLKNQNSKKVTDDVLELLNNMFADYIEKPTRTEVSRIFEGFLAGYVEVINESTGEVFDHTQYTPLSDATIINYLGNWGDRIATHMKRAGNRQLYIGKYLPYHSLDVEFAGEVLSIDDRQPPFEYSKGQRAWFYMGVDVASQAWTVWVHGRSKEGIIVDFYRQLLRNYTEWGFCLPAELECESSLNSSFRDTFLRPGAMFDDAHIIANNARSKYIERMFGKLRYEEEKQHTGWIARPFAKKEDNQAGGQDVPLIPYTQIVDNSLRDIEEWNNSEHPDYPGKTRWEIFEEKQHPALKATNWNAILPYLGYKTETSCNAGIIRFNNNEFLIGDNGAICTGSRLIDLMKEIEGRQLDVYWLDGNDSKVMKAIVMLRNDDRIICEAMAKPVYSRSRIGRTPEGMQAASIMSAYANTIEAYARERKNRLEDVIVIDNRPKTLNRKFQIKDVKHRPADEVPHETEALPEMQEDDYTDNYPRTASLKDRF